MFLNFGDAPAFEAMQAIQKLRAQNIKAELYPDNAKIDKQFKHAEKRGIPFVVKEIGDENYTLKNIVTGEQVQVTLSELVNKLQ